MGDLVLFPPGQSFYWRSHQSAQIALIFQLKAITSRAEKFYFDKKRFLEPDGSVNVILNQSDLSTLVASPIELIKKKQKYKKIEETLFFMSSDPLVRASAVACWAISHACCYFEILFL
ncbi:unnamed protein product [Trichogramma brassicae]|uniref:Uncharacterized protein n=1 Tax=Trichogramma brassicae TaxID=86971 RepID=A0A6H5IP46_9HYME|nr:unnamed protein product [Trichogramma brassicae]